MKFLLPQGIGDALWALTKIQSIADRAGDGLSEVFLSGAGHEIESRALDFVRRFDFVTSANMAPYAIHPADAPVDPDGKYNYIEDGWHEFAVANGWRTDRLCALMPNGPLERGVRLEDWLPHYPIDWTIASRFRIAPSERELAQRVLLTLGDYVVFYLGPLRGNTTDGHNRGPLWKPSDWLELGRRINREYGLPIVVVGAAYDAAYWDTFIGPSLNGDFGYWVNLIGKTNVGQLYAITQGARFVVSYQSGVGIFSTYMGTPTAIFWRPHGDSISPSLYLSFDERMASAWCPPIYIENGNHLPLIYGKDGIESIMESIARRGWVK